MGLDARRALGAVHLSLGYDTTVDEIDAATSALRPPPCSTWRSEQP
jgi:cysteine sulfinate desulfinase/cysteine desulfurase-like protein